MQNAKRAAIASAFIYPGAGLFLLKHYVRGCVFAIPATIVILMLFANLLHVSAELNREIAGQMISPALIHMMWVKLHSAFYDAPTWQNGKWLLLASWILSIISSYSAGKQLDVANAKRTQA